VTTLANGNYTDTITVTLAHVNNSPATISVSTHVGSLLFNDNFSGQAQAIGTVGPLGFASGWSVANGSYTYKTAEGHTQAGLEAPRGQTTTVSTNFQLASTSDYPGGLRG